MEYIRLFVYNRKLLCFGIAFTFFSCFGKTFIISQYVPFLLKEFSLTNTSFSLLYALATIISGIFIVYLGRLLDRTELMKYALLVTFGLILSTLLIGISGNIVFLAIGLFGLRLSGQGLMNHTSLTAISRFFKRSRGKAVSIVVLGHALGEAILPLGVVLLISAFGWRDALLYSSMFVLVTLIPVVYIFVRRIPKVNEDFVQVTKKKKCKTKENWSVRKVLFDNQFYLLAPNLLLHPFIFTALMFYLMPLAHNKGWSQEWISYCFIGFGAANLCSSFIAGQFIDRAKAIKFLPYNFIPLILAISGLLIFQGHWVALVFLMLAGVSNGFNLTLEASVITEVFGMKNIATVKSLFTTLSVIGTALGPIVFGLFLDHGYSFEKVLLVTLVLLFLVTVNSMRGHTKKHYKIKSVWEIPKVILHRKGYLK